jgi:glutamate carboxypeptidase
MTVDALNGYFAQKKEEIVRELLGLAGIDSPSSSKLCTDRAISYLTDRFQSFGVMTERIPQTYCGDFLKVSLEPKTCKGRPPTLMLCHVDTVWPEGETIKRPPAVEGDRLLGPGVYDMKAGIVEAIFAMEAIKILSLPLQRPVDLLINTDEELGSKHSKGIIMDLADKAKAVLVLEPAGANEAVKTFRKGTGIFEIQVEGRASHAGADPEKGISAILELAGIITKLYGEQRLDLGTTINVGQVRAGIARNVVAPEAWANVDVRANTMQELTRVDNRIKELHPRHHEAVVTVSGGIVRPPMVKTTGTEEIYQQARQIAAQIGYKLSECGSGGASDGNFAAASGAAVLDGLGADGAGPHALHEYITISSLVRRTDLLTRLLQVL